MDCKKILETKINCFVFYKPKNDNSNFSNKLLSIAPTLCHHHGKYQNLNDFRAVSERFRRLI